MNHASKTALIASLCCANAMAQMPVNTPATLADDGRSVVVGRYSTESAVPPPDLVDPMDTVAALTFPRQTIQSIGDAVQYTLARTGYSFASSEGSPSAHVFLDLPLPESQRQIGPYSVLTIVKVLLGTAWQPVVYQVDRTVHIRPNFGNPSSPPSSPTAPPPAIRVPASGAAVAAGKARAVAVPNAVVTATRRAPPLPTPTIGGNTP